MQDESELRKIRFNPFNRFNHFNPQGTHAMNEPPRLLPDRPSLLAALSGMGIARKFTRTPRKSWMMSPV